MVEFVTNGDPESSVAEQYAEGLRYFRVEGKLNNSLARLSADLKDHDIDYIVIGAVDLADVQELTKIERLDDAFGEKLDPYVRLKFLELKSSVISNDSNQEQE